MKIITNTHKQSTSVKGRSNIPSHFLFKDKAGIVQLFGEEKMKILLATYHGLNTKDVQTKIAKSSKNFIFESINNHSQLLVLDKNTLQPIGGQLLNGKTNLDKRFEVDDFEYIAAMLQDEKFWMEPFAYSITLETIQSDQICASVQCIDGFSIQPLTLQVTKKKRIKDIIISLKDWIKNSTLQGDPENVEKARDRFYQEVMNGVKQLQEIVESYTKDVLNIQRTILQKKGYKGLREWRKFNESDLTEQKKHEKIIFLYREKKIAEYDIFKNEYISRGVFQVTARYLQNHVEAIERIANIKEILNKKLPSGAIYIIEFIKNDIIQIRLIPKNAMFTFVTSEEFSPNDNVTEKIQKLVASYQQEQKQSQDRLQTWFRSRTFSGTYIGITICSLIQRNPKGLTASLIEKITRNLRLTPEQYNNVVFSEKDRVFETLQPKSVEHAVYVMVNEGILSSHNVRGGYGSFLVYRATQWLDTFMKMSETTRSDNIGDMTEIEFSEYLKEICNGTQMNPDLASCLDTLLNHPGIFCVDRDTVTSFMKLLPETYMTYIDILQKSETEAWKKRYLRALCQLAK